MLTGVCSFLMALFTVKPDRAFLFGWWKRVEARRVAAEN